jgi:hypothetical protein
LFLKSLADPQNKTANARQLWLPFPESPQELAYLHPADLIYFGGGAGGGKSDLGLGLALTAHQRCLFLRREATQLGGVVERLREILSEPESGREIGNFNEQKSIWRNIPGGRLIQLGGCKELNDRQKWQGVPFDLYIFDEAPQFLKDQVMFIMGWNRTSKKGQRCRVIFTGNPPTTAEGQWIVEMFAPWLDPNHPDPAVPGEMRWYAVFDGQEVEVPGPKHGTDRPEPIEHEAKLPDGSTRTELIYPKSRTFIPARVTDNPVYMRTPDYIATLQAMPEPLRTQMLYGDHTIGAEDDAYQVIPTQWVIDAQNRWIEYHKLHKKPPGPMDCLGADIARGGKDTAACAPRHGVYFGVVKEVPGTATPNGLASAKFILENAEPNAKVMIDVIGIGSSAYDTMAFVEDVLEVADEDAKQALKELSRSLDVYPINWALPSKARDLSTKFGFVNKRAQYAWQFREALAPESGLNIMLPPGPRVRADLTALTWEPQMNGIKIIDKKALRKKLGRSTNVGDAIILSTILDVDVPFSAATAGEGNKDGEFAVRS